MRYKYLFRRVSPGALLYTSLRDLTHPREFSLLLFPQWVNVLFLPSRVFLWNFCQLTLGASAHGIAYLYKTNFSFFFIPFTFGCCQKPGMTHWCSGPSYSCSGILLHTHTSAILLLANHHCKGVTSLSLFWTLYYTHPYLLPSLWDSAERHSFLLFSVAFLADANTILELKIVLLMSRRCY